MTKKKINYMNQNYHIGKENQMDRIRSKGEER